MIQMRFLKQMKQIISHNKKSKAKTKKHSSFFVILQIANFFWKRRAHIKPKTRQMNTDDRHQKFSLLLRFALGLSKELPSSISDAEWQAIYRTAQEQTVASVIYQGVKRLPTDMRPPFQILMNWAAEAERVAGMNTLLIESCQKLTQLFAAKGRRTAILKGQANALLYPEPLSRQPGDIDLWVEGGRQSVLQLLDEMKLEYTASYHHAHLKKPLYDAVVEVHFRPSSGNHNPYTNERLQRAVEEEIVKSTMTEKGFCVPTLRFALLMQLSHIQRHFLNGGIGLRHLTDYFLLLKSGLSNITEKELKQFGLRKSAGAVMWVLEHQLGLDREHMICPPDKYRGEWMEKIIFDGGNFGRYTPRRKMGLWKRFLTSRWEQLKIIPFDPRETIWTEIKFWKAIITTIPERIKAGSWSLSEAERKKKR